MVKMTMYDEYGMHCSEIILRNYSEITNNAQGFTSRARITKELYGNN